MRTATFPTPASVCRNGKDNWILFDSASELAKHAIYGNKYSSYGQWTGGTKAECVQWASAGRNDLVAASDAFLEKFEALNVPSPRSRIVDDVTGAVPNIPAYLAGVPTSMRRRERFECETAPITMIVDCSSSAAISTNILLKRAATLLALVRIVSVSRPIELWAGCGLGNPQPKLGCYVFSKVDAAPLDIARACYQLGHPGYARGLCYNVGGMPKHGDWDGLHWPYGGTALTVEKFKAVAKQMFPGTRLLAIPGIHATDDCVKNPEAWLKKTIAALETSVDV